MVTLSVMVREKLPPALSVMFPETTSLKVNLWVTLDPSDKVNVTVSVLVMVCVGETPSLNPTVRFSVL